MQRRRSVASRRLRAGGAVPLGKRAGASWQRARFEGPYLRDELLGLGVFVETLETAHTWSRLDELYAGRRRRAAGRARSGLDRDVPRLPRLRGRRLALLHVPRPRPPRARRSSSGAEAKAAACEAIVATEGTITHHHAVGRDHAPYMAAEVGELGLEALRAVKERLDPAGIMNPGKLLPS